MVEDLDDLSASFADRLAGTYDCPDRIVLNAFYPLGYNPGGFREWWRRLFGGDESLDDAHLMRMAGRFSRRLRAWANANGVPFIVSKQGQRKHLIAEQYIPRDPKYRGVFLILAGRASAPLWHVRRSPQGRIVSISRRKDQTFVNHLLQVLRYVHLPSLDDRVWDELPQAAQLSGRRVPGIDLSSARMRAVVEAVIALAPDPGGFTVSQLATKVREIAGYSDTHYHAWSAAYDLCKLRAKNLVARQPASRRYHPTANGLPALAALLVIVDKVIRPVLAGAGKPRPGRPRQLDSPQEYHYRALQTEMWNLLQTLGITPQPV